MPPNHTDNQPTAPPAPLRWSTVYVAVFLGVLSGLAAWFLLLRLYPVIVIAAVGFGLAYLFDPLLDRLEARGWSRGKAVGLVAVGCLLVLGLALGIVVPLLAGQVKTLVTNWPQYSAQIQAALDVEHLSSVLARWFPREQITPYLQEQADNAQAWLEAQLPKVFGWVSGALVRSATALGYIFITLLVALYAMMVIDPFRKAFAALFSQREAKALATVDRKVTYMLGQYLRGMFLTCLGISVTNAILLQVVGFIFGTQFSLLLGALAGVAYLVPYLGMLTAVVVTGLLAYFTASSNAWIAAALSIGVIMVANQIFDSLVMPRIVGRKVGLHPLAIVLALLAGGTLLGIWGMILATPLAATIKIILAQWVPVVATVPDVPEDKQPLVLDFGGFVAHTWGTVRSAGHKLEEHLAVLGKTRDEEEPK